MTGAISDTATGQVFGSSGGGFLALLTIDHPSLSEPIRVCDNIVNITSNGNLFLAFPFLITLPSDKDQAPPAAQLTIDNTSRELAQIIRSIVSPPSVDISIVRLDDFDTIEVSLPSFNLVNVSWDALTMTGDLTIDDITNEPFPQRNFTPAEYPGIF